MLRTKDNFFKSPGKCQCEQSEVGKAEHRDSCCILIKQQVS